MPQLTPPPQLCDKILEQIHYEQRLRLLKRKIFLYCAGLIASLASFLVVAKDFFLQAKQTGFMEFSGLLISDFHTISSHLSDYLLSLAESLPAVSFLFVCFALLIIILSIFKMLTSAAEIRQLKHV